MKTSYDYTIKTILERVTIVTIEGEDVEVPIISNDFEPNFPLGATTEEKTTIRQEARQSFRQAVREYLIAYLRGKEIEAAQVVSTSPTIKGIEGTTQTITI